MGSIEENGLLLGQLRNVWGNHFVWSGPWAENSLEWEQYPEVRRHHQRPEHADTGRFWMSWNDICLAFDPVDVCSMPKAERKASHVRQAPRNGRAGRRGCRQM